MITTFIHIPKTAGTTINWILRSTYGLKHCDAEPVKMAQGKKSSFCAKDLRLVQIIYPQLKSIAGHSIHPYSDSNETKSDFRYFTFLRDPVKRCLSFFMYKKHVGNEQKFETILKWTANAMTRHIAGKTDINYAKIIIQKKSIFCGTADRFNESLFLLRALHIPELNIHYKSINVTPKSSEYNELLSNKRLKEMILEENTVDLELYKYVSEELLPEYRARYGPNIDTDIASFFSKDNEFNKTNIFINRVYRNLLYKPVLSVLRATYIR